MAYLDEFNAAIARTKEFGLCPPDFVPNNIAYLDEQRMSRVPYALLREFGELSAKNLVAQCLSIHFRLVPVLQQLFGTAPIFTVGYVDFSGEPRFQTSESYLRGLLEHGIGGNTFDAHAWLTLPSMEILDFSLPTSMAIINGWKDGHGGILSGHADHLKHGLSYHPQLTGTQYLFGIGAARIAS